MAGRRPRRWVIRAGFALLLVASTAWLGHAALSSHPSPAEAATSSPDSQVAPADGITVITAQGVVHTNTKGGIVAFDRHGDRLFRSTTYSSYFDVDPVPGTAATVEYIATRGTTPEQCPLGDKTCSLNVYIRRNLSTGDKTEIWRDYGPRNRAGRHHDIDRINETHLIIADIWRNSVWIVNLTSGDRTWSFPLTRAYSRAVDGGEPGDWEHLNDVEILPDGRVMLSPRNFDRVVFLQPGIPLRGATAEPTGPTIVQRAWTLGEQDTDAILADQHNPDYLAGPRGAGVIVPDSGNDRIIEYHRVGGAWRPAWTWRDATLNNPRDADRLPNGNTLITDSHGDRVLEVTPTGTVVWNVSIGNPYEAERLGTGDESAGGPLADAAFENHTNASTSGVEGGQLNYRLRTALPERIIDAAIFVAPPWMTVLDVVIAAVALVTWVGWVVGECVWAVVWWHRQRGRALPGPLS